MRIITILLLLSFCSKIRSQDLPYAVTDSVMLGYKEKIRTVEELYKLVYFIRTNFREDSLRLRAAFIWITENIAYDVRAFQNDDPAAAKLSYVIKNKKAICSGYAELVKFFCDAFNIESDIVEGHARSTKRDIHITRNVKRPNHAWNAVKVNGTWRLLDATWAAGVVDDRDDDNWFFQKQFNEVYYFTRPDRFLLNHFPVDKRYFFTETRTDLGRYLKGPLFTSALLADEIEVVYPDRALIQRKKGDTIIFRLKTDKQITDMYAISDRSDIGSYQGVANFSDGMVEFRYPVTFAGNYNLYIGYSRGISGYTLAAYRLEVR